MNLVIERELTAGEVVFILEQYNFVVYAEMDDCATMYCENDGRRYWLKINYADKTGLLYYYTDAPEEKSEEASERDWADDISLPDDIYGDGSDLLKWRNTSHRH